MNKEQIWSTICSLAHSQGFYGRLAEAIEENGRKDEILQELENQHFSDAVDMVLYFEQ